MKKLINLLPFVVIIILFCSCGSIGNKQNDNVIENREQEVCWYAYDYIVNKKIANDQDNGHKHKVFDGLAIKLACCVDDDSFLGDPEPDYTYLYFDDEADYNNVAKEWIMAYQIAEELFNWNDENRVYRDWAGMYIVDYDKPYKFKHSFDYLAEHLQYLKDFPNTGMIPRDMWDPFAKAFYDHKDEPVYIPSSGYGYREYPEGNCNGKPCHYYHLSRAKGIEGIEDGTLIIYKSLFY